MGLCKSTEVEICNKCYSSLDFAGQATARAICSSSSTPPLTTPKTEKKDPFAWAQLFLTYGTQIFEIAKTGRNSGRRSEGGTGEDEPLVDPRTLPPTPPPSSGGMDTKTIGIIVGSVVVVGIIIYVLKNNAKTA